MVDKHNGPSSKNVLENNLTSMNEQLVESARLLNNILESSTEYSIISMDLEGLILTWNEGARRNYGYTTKDVVKKMNIQNLHHPRDVASGRVDAFFDKTLKHGKAEEVFERVRKNGDRFIASVVMTLRRNEKGKPIGYLLMSKDVTEQKRIEMQAQINQELEEQNKRVKEATRIKSEFLANMSHELRTPLNGIIGFTELMYSEKVGEISPLHKEYLGDILKSSQHLLQLINNVLDLSKVESGRMEFSPELLDLNKVIEEVRDIMRTLIARKQIKFKISVEANLTDVYIDPAKLKQILYNYISNALKFTPIGGNITVKMMHDGKKDIRLEVIDTGIGIKKEDVSKLFMEFQQINSNYSKKIIGTGLGLALTRKIVEAQGGHVGVVSQPNKGSTFFAVLPRQPIEAEVKSLSPKKLNENVHRDAPCILVIEDEMEDQNLMLQLLNRAGFAVDLAGTAEEAIAKINEHRYDAITLDLILPDMSGWDLLAEIRTRSINKNTPTIVTTVIHEKEASLGYLINDFLIKPIRRADLLKALKFVGIKSKNKKKQEAGIRKPFTETYKE